MKNNGNGKPSRLVAAGEALRAVLTPSVALDILYDDQSAADVGSAQPNDEDQRHNPTSQSWEVTLEPIPDDMWRSIEALIRWRAMGHTAGCQHEGCVDLRRKLEGDLDLVDRVIEERRATGQGNLSEGRSTNGRCVHGTREQFACPQCTAEGLAHGTTRTD